MSVHALKSQAPTPPKRKTILMASEDPIIRQILLHLLTKDGFCVISAINDAEAFHSAHAIQFDFILIV